MKQGQSPAENLESKNGDMFYLIFNFLKIILINCHVNRKKRNSLVFTIHPIKNQLTPTCQKRKKEF